MLTPEASLAIARRVTSRIAIIPAVFPRQAASASPVGLREQNESIRSCNAIIAEWLAAAQIAAAFWVLEAMSR